VRLNKFPEQVEKTIRSYVNSLKWRIVRIS
jgi:hypothetical protein